MNNFFGPSTLVAAAFIGPGTVTVCSMAGVTHGCSLLWALLFSVVSTMILQEMAARLGWYTQTGLGSAVRVEKSKSLAGILMFYLVIFAVLVGNAAYEAGNIGGAVLGMNLFVEQGKLWTIVLGGLAFALLFFSQYKLLEKLLIGLVILMSFSFLVTAFFVMPPLSQILGGLLPSATMDQDWLMIMGLIGTTVVPYNLFLHASLISEKYKKEDKLKSIRTENFIAVGLGGMISMLILIVAAGSADKVANISSAADIAIQLEPLFGSMSKIMIGIGLFAAGLSSAITAPLAAALAARELFNWNKDEKDIRFRMVWMSILGIGILFALTGIKPVLIIKFAQIMNGLLLPIIAIYLLWLVNKKDLLGDKVNSNLLNILGGMVVVITFTLSLKTLISVF